MIYILPFKSFAFKVTTAAPTQIRTKIVPKTTSESDFEEKESVLTKNIFLYHIIILKNFSLINRNPTSNFVHYYFILFLKLFKIYAP